MSHTPEFIREIFADAVEAMTQWTRTQGEEPVIGFEQEVVTISLACKLVSRCSDQLPRDLVEVLSEHGCRTGTYAAGAQAMYRWRQWLLSEKNKRMLHGVRVIDPKESLRQAIEGTKELFGIPDSWSSRV